jgi:hypothetical protein
MGYSVNLEGFEGQAIEVQPAGMFGSAKLFINGNEARPGAKRGEMILTRNDGREVSASWRNNFFDIPKLVVDGKVVNVVEPLKWYEWVWGGWPIVLLFGGGAIGGFFGALALVFNVKVFRSGQRTLVKYLVSGAISITALILYFIFALLFSILLNN